MTQTALASPPCPITMVWAILTDNSKIGEDPDATLEGCEMEVNEGIATITTQ